MGVQIPSKDITYFEQCFSYVGGTETELQLHSSIDFIVMFLVNPAYAMIGQENGGGEDDGPSIRMSYDEDLNRIEIQYMDRIIDLSTVEGNIRLNGEVVSGENLNGGYHEEENNNFSYLWIYNVESVNDDTMVSWAGMRDTEGNVIIPENGIEYGDWGPSNYEQGGGPTIDNSNLPPFYGLFYAMVLGNGFSEEQAGDATKPYAVIGKIINKLKRL